MLPGASALSPLSGWSPWHSVDTIRQFSHTRCWQLKIKLTWGRHDDVLVGCKLRYLLAEGAIAVCLCQGLSLQCWNSSQMEAEKDGVWGILEEMAEMSRLKLGVRQWRVNLCCSSHLMPSKLLHSSERWFPKGESCYCLLCEATVGIAEPLGERWKERAKGRKGQIFRVLRWFMKNFSIHNTM